MIVPVIGIDSLEEYERKKHLLKPLCKPTVCPDCNAKDRFWYHGSYSRTVIDISGEATVKIMRYLCSSCDLVVSCLFSFLIPYSVFSANMVALAVHSYAQSETSYRYEADSMVALDSDDQLRPSHSSVFRWVDAFSRRAEQLIFHVQKELALRGNLQHIEKIKTMICPNGVRARAAGKESYLHQMAGVTQAAQVFADGEAVALSTLHAKFLYFVESLQSIFCHHSLRLPTPQTVIRLAI